MLGRRNVALLWDEGDSTYSAAWAGFRNACTGSTVDPSDIWAKATRFCLRTERMKPFNLTS